MRQLVFSIVASEAFALDCLEHLTVLGHRVVSVCSSGDSISSKTFQANIKFCPSKEFLFSANTPDYYIICDPENFDLNSLALDEAHKEKFIYLDLNGHGFDFQRIITQAILYDEPSVSISWHSLVDSDGNAIIYSENFLSLNQKTAAGDFYNKAITEALNQLDDWVISLARENLHLPRQKISNHPIKKLLDLSSDLNLSYEEIERTYLAYSYDNLQSQVGNLTIRHKEDKVSVGAICKLETSSSEPPGTILQIEKGSISISTLTKDVCFSKLLVLSGPPIDFLKLKKIFKEKTLKYFSDIFKFCFNKADLFSELSLSEKFELAAKTEVDKAALKHGNEEVSYRELLVLVSQASACLAARNISTGDKIAVILDRGFSSIIAMLAILRLGATYIPISLKAPLRHIESILFDSSPSIIIIDEVASNELLEADFFKKYKNNLLLNDCLTSNNLISDDTALFSPQSEKEAAYIIYTSGSTGKPKGVLLNFQNVLELFESTKDLFLFLEDDIWFQLHSLTFDFSIWEIFGALLNGATLVIPSEKEIQSSASLRKVIDSNKVTILNITPSAFGLLLQEESRQKSRMQYLRYIIFGGEAIQKKDILHWNKIYTKSRVALINMYGITEVTIHATFSKINPISLLNDSIGRPLPGKTIYVLDEHFKPINPGEEGEMFVGGHGIASLYLNNPPLTKEKFVDGRFLYHDGENILFKTGDRAILLESGELAYRGRLDDQIKILGHRVEVGEIVSVVQTYPAIKKAVGIAYVDNDNLTRVIVFYTSLERIVDSLLLSFLADKLPGYMMPWAFVKIEEFPVNLQGKLDKDLLLDSYRKTKKNILLPDDSLELTLKLIWREIFDLREIQNNDDFFLLGGNSLLAMQLLSRVSSRLNLSMTIREVMRNPVFKNFLNLIKSKYSSPELVNQNTSFDPIKKQEMHASKLQQSIYFLNTYVKGGNPSYNVNISMDLRGDLNVKLLEKSILYLLNRHQSLRTAFYLKEGVLFQKILSLSEYKLKTKDLSQGGCDLSSIEVGFGREGFILSEPPLVDFLLIKLDCNKHKLLIKFHHIIHDGWSINIFVRELVLCYNAFRNNLDPSLSALEYSYLDYTYQQNLLLEDSDFREKALTYWKNAISFKEPVSLPYDYERPNAQVFEGDRKAFHFDSDLVVKLKKYALTHSATLPTVFLLAISILIYKYSGKHYATIGLPVANRDQDNFENIIGLFANTVAIQLHTEENDTLLNLLNRAKKTSLDALENSKLPFSEVVNQLSLDRDALFNPLFQVMLVYHNEHEWREKTNMDGLDCNIQFSHNMTSKFDLTFEVSEDKDSLACLIEYNTALFKETTIENCFKHLTKILNELLSDDKQPVSHLNILSDDDICLHKALILDRSTHQPSSLFELFKLQAEKTPKAIALEHDDIRLEYRSLLTRVNQMANKFLQIKGFSIASGAPEVRVGLYFTQSFDMVIVMLALLKLGVAYIPMDTRFPGSRIQYIINDADIKYIFTSQTLDGDIFLSLPVEVVCIEEIDVRDIQTKEKNNHCISTGDSEAYVIYTSGTTGTPKGVPIKHAHVTHLLLAAQEIFQISETDSTVLAHSVAFDVSVWEIFYTLSFGSKLVLLDQKNISSVDKFYSFLLNKEITFLNQTPSAFSRLVKYIKATNSDGFNELFIRLVIFAGEPVCNAPT